MITVPKPEEEAVKELLSRLALTADPFFIDVNPGPDDLMNECFENVNRKVASAGGERIIGWQIWQHPYMIEAELHAVWQDADGQFEDVTPKGLKTDHILFVPDRRHQPDGKQVNNKRIRTTTNLLADDFIALAEAAFSLANKDERAGQTGEIRFTGAEAQNWNAINGLMIRIDEMLCNNQTRNSPCFCSSGNKYKHCHGKDLIFKLKHYKI
jgi:hypothetical protein